MHLVSARVLLDAPAVAPLFGAIPALDGESPVAAELVALWIKPGRHFNAHYRLSFAGRSRTVFASAFALGEMEAAKAHSRLRAHRRDVDRVRCPHCCGAVVPAGLLLQLFPFDYRLPTLPACLDPDRVNAALGAGSGIASCEPVGYRPGMRCQVRYSTPRQTLFGKVAVEPEPGRAFSRSREIYDALATERDDVHVVRPLRFLPELRLGLTQATPGESFHDLLCAGREVEPVIRSVATALAKVHRLSVAAVDRAYAVEDELGLVGSWVELVAEWYPTMAAPLRACEADVRRLRPDTVAPRALVHRDFHDKQILVATGTLTLLDLDTACQGDPEIDLGNFAAHLALRGLQLGQEDRCRALEGAFTAAYPAPVAGDRVGWYRRTSLLRLACVYALRPRWHHLAPALVQEAMRP